MHGKELQQPLNWHGKQTIQKTHSFREKLTMDYFAFCISHGHSIFKKSFWKHCQQCLSSSLGSRRHGCLKALCNVK